MYTLAKLSLNVVLYPSPWLLVPDFASTTDQLLSVLGNACKILSASGTLVAGINILLSPKIVSPDEYNYSIV